MSGKIEITRELAEQTLRFLMSPGDGWEAGQITQELRATLAAPVVERQEPVAVVLPERKHVPDFTLHPMLNKEHSGWNACLDKVKELNQ